MPPTAAIPPPTLITEPLTIFVFLLAMTGSVFYVSEFRALRKFFHYLPPLIFCYFLPMIATTLGVIPKKSDLYSWFNTVFLPPVLLLLLLSADLKAILRLGPRAVGVFLAGSFGIIAGAMLGFALFHGRLDPHGAQNIGALTGSWIGGSANMFAVKSALEIPDEAFSPMIIVDSVFAYSWMGMLIACARLQEAYARRFRAETSALDDVNRRVGEFASAKRDPATTRDLLVMFAVAMVGGWLCMTAGKWGAAQVRPWAESLKAAGSLRGASIVESFSASTLTIIVVTALGVVLSFTPLRKLERTGASNLGYAMLFLLLPTFGAQADLREIGRLHWYAAVAVTMLATHGLCIFAAMRLTRAPLFFGATASQANVGGPASASVVAATYQPALAPVGVLLGILGGILGTYSGLIAAQLCRLIAG